MSLFCGGALTFLSFSNRVTTFLSNRIKAKNIIKFKVKGREELLL